MQGEMFTDAETASYTSAAALTRAALIHGCTWVLRRQPKLLAQIVGPIAKARSAVHLRTMKRARKLVLELTIDTA
jgi:hypothetical protein